MIPTKARESRRMKALKLPKNLERRYKETKCRDCTVVVKRMDFAKILGKFTKVKIKYEPNTPVKTKRPINQISPSSRLISNENGMVQVHRTYPPHHKLVGKKGNEAYTRPNILKENNRMKKNENMNNIKQLNSKIKHYSIVFEEPKVSKSEEESPITLDDLLPTINKGILPSVDWSIDYFPKNSELKDDKIYDRIAAELEDLMFNEKTNKNSESKDDKSDEFPSIMDILNDNPKTSSPSKSAESNTVTIQSGDVDAMLIDNPSTKPTPMVVDTADNISTFLTGIEPLTNVENKPAESATPVDDNPQSPSILNEEPHEFKLDINVDTSKPNEIPQVTVTVEPPKSTDNSENSEPLKPVESDKSVPAEVPVLRIGITKVVFKKNNDGNCVKTVTCPKNLKYSISISDKPIELLGAPKVISCLEDLQVLLQIVDESELSSKYVLH